MTTRKNSTLKPETSWIGAVHDPRHMKYFLEINEPRLSQFAHCIMLGRSNVGKSSLINHLCKAKNAFVSSEPGKTRGFYFYECLPLKLILVDLPGYGFAKTSHDERNAWKDLFEHYLNEWPHARKVLFLFDSRRGVESSSFDWLTEIGQKFTQQFLVFTKADLLKTQSERALMKAKVKKDLLENGISAEMISAFVSTKKGETDSPEMRKLESWLKD